MKENEIIQSLKSLRSIEPREEFSRSLRHTLFTTEKHVPLPAPATPHATLFRFSLALTFATIMLFVGLQIFPADSSPQLSGLDNEEILNEMVSSGDINIYLNEISYHDEANQAITFALNELTQE